MPATIFASRAFCSAASMPRCNRKERRRSGSVSSATRRQRDAAIASTERAVRQQREQERCDFVGERWIGLATERRDLRPLYGVDQTKLRVDHTRVSLRPAKFGADCSMDLDKVLNRQIA